VVTVLVSPLVFETFPTFGVVGAFEFLTFSATGGVGAFDFLPFAVTVSVTVTVDVDGLVSTVDVTVVVCDEVLLLLPYDVLVVTALPGMV